MADVSPSGTRVVPVMAGQKHNPKVTKVTRDTLHTTPRQSQPRESQELWDDPECLNMPCLEALGLYASNTVGDGMCCTGPEQVSKEKRDLPAPRPSNWAQKSID